MFGFKKRAKKTISSLIGAGTRVEGNVRFQGGLRVDGQIDGNVYSDTGQANVLVIGEHGGVDGEVRVGHLVVNGAIHGPVFATELLELHPKAQIDGDVVYKELEMHSGAVVRGVLSDNPEGIREGAKPALKLASNRRY